MQVFSCEYYKIFKSSQGIFWTYIAFDYRTLPLFGKIMQSFILMQNTQKRDWIGWGCWCPFLKTSALFHKKIPFLPNIECCPKFLEYTRTGFLNKGCVRYLNSCTTSPAYILYQLNEKTEVTITYHVFFYHYHCHF